MAKDFDYPDIKNLEHIIDQTPSESIQKEKKLFSLPMAKLNLQEKLDECGLLQHSAERSHTPEDNRFCETNSDSPKVE